MIFHLQQSQDVSTESGVRLITAMVMVTCGQAGGCKNQFKSNVILTEELYQHHHKEASHDSQELMQRMLDDQK